uniref:Helicase ATP-binding domain-containing protein n=1 Tax=Ananas comosus var. bracteatus TaxID=296719 RepID=A0A6V7QFW2_ANACO|nr:unnamed protein product [Ananas comosus var. bracteatus]
MMEAPSFALDDGDDVRLAPSFSMIYFFVLSILLFIFLFFPLPHPLLYPQDFDWDAAVREIDSACRVASTSTSDRQGFAAPPAASSSAPESRPKPAKINGKARQLTLERFVDSFTKRKKIGDGPFGSRIWERDAPVDQGKEGNPGAGDEPPAVRIDLEAAKTWIYPVNVPLRDYQLSIARSALFSNTLVALPTGLGKTLIAAVVMYNYFRWFPEGKIVFAAPSRPLVMQQIEACHNIVGIPQEWTIDMTGQMSPSKRSTFWKSKRVFFVTPQVLEKDIQSGICLVRQLVCLVIDEAHRALGNYSYCVAVRELMAIPVQLRILALTATPGSKQQTIQNVIDNLCISTLEYRNESDHDVSPYVHNRQLEVIQVSMGDDAIAINNLLLEVIRPYVARLCAIGVLHNRDSATLSPCELLNSRDKFRQAPPSNLPHTKYGEVEGCFGVLITLYHVRKLLSSHGIRPAYEMLQEKLKQGSFSRLMSRNETMWKAKLLMQQNLSVGAPNPKLMKMTEVLIDHFRKKDPKDSRVIIFSNFRGSVKDIMNSLANVGGDLIKATEFIGQSSGKTLKGQTQKVQQAVLQKFRTGGYNVIVATSIGSELKGYLKKQASSKSIRKHMNNGGLKSFDFHASPRMIPHICKPEVQFVELSIEQFIPRGKKVKTDASDKPPLLKNISDTENKLISKYFHHAWKPSLIAFPSFQTFPCCVHNVQHSFRTTAMLIDAMQQLQGLSFSKTMNDPSPARSPDLPGDNNVWEKQPQEKVGQVEVFSREVLECESGLCMPDAVAQKPSAHCFYSVATAESDKELQSNLRKKVTSWKAAEAHNNRSTTEVEQSVEVEGSSKSKSMDNEQNLTSYSPEFSGHNEHSKFVLETPVCKAITHVEDSTGTPGKVEIMDLALVGGESRKSIGDMELSPRLTHYIEEGIVPESPMVKVSHCPLKVKSIMKSASLPLENNTDKRGMHHIQDSVHDTERNVDVLVSPLDGKLETPLANPRNNSSSEGWQLSSGGASRSVQRAPKFKRLCKYGEKIKRLSCRNLEEKYDKRVQKSHRSTVNQPESVRGKKKSKRCGRMFIEEEAEISEDAVVSEDEEDENEGEYEDSFIDDSTNPTEACTHVENNRNDMMAFYRRSLLTQSPLETLPRCLAASYDSVSSRKSESESCSSEKHNSSIHTQYGLPSTAHSTERRALTSTAMNEIGETSNNQKDISAKLESRKRKLSFQHAASMPVTNFKPPSECQSGNAEVNDKLFFDDDFYLSIDLDAVEAQATELLKVKSGVSVGETQAMNPDNSIGIKRDLGMSCPGSPSFDLGI